MSNGYKDNLIFKEIAMKPIRDKVYQNELKKTGEIRKFPIGDGRQKWSVSNGLKRYFLLLFFAAAAVLLVSCGETKDKRINLDTGVKSDNLANNALTRPIAGAFSLLIGEGIDLRDAKVFTNDAGFMEIQVTGYNRAVYTKRFDYKVEWLDKNGVVVDSKASVWLSVSAKSRTTFSFKNVAPSKDSVDFRMNTRKTPK
jgi:hypothetical protein